MNEMATFHWYERFGGIFEFLEADWTLRLYIVFKAFMFGGVGYTITALKAVKKSLFITSPAHFAVILS